LTCKNKVTTEVVLVSVGMGKLENNWTIIL